MSIGQQGASSSGKEKFRPSINEEGSSESSYQFKITGLENVIKSVLEFKCNDHAISSDYTTLITVKSLPLQYDKIIGKSALLSMRWGDKEFVYLHGVIKNISLINKVANADKISYCVLEMASPVNLLHYHRQNRVFLNKTVLEVLQDVFNEHTAANISYDIKTKTQFPTREIIIQYDESDFDFVMRLMSHYGLYFFFEQNEKTAVLVVQDKVEDLKSISGKKLRFQAITGQPNPTESMWAIRSRAQFLTANVKLKDYNYRQPEVPLQIESKATHAIEGHGTDYRYGEHYKTLEEGQVISTLRQQALDWQRETFVAQTDCRGLMPGFRFEVCDHQDEKFNQEYLVIEVEHQASEANADVDGADNDDPLYTNKVLLIPASTPYRTPAQPMQKIYGSFTATVETTGGDYAYLDEQGRYRLRLPFDIGDANKGEATHTVRLAQPYSGDQYGFHFPLHAGTEVIVSCVNGDIDRPMMMGTVSNPATPSTVTNQNNTQNILRTWGDNELLMEDQKGQERVDLFTKDQKNILSLDAKSDGHLVRLATEEGKMEIYAAKTILTESGDTHTMESGNDHIVTVENSQKLMTKNKEIEYQAATDILMKAGQNIKMHAEKNNIEQTAQKNMIIKVGQTLSMEVRNQNMQVKVNAGNLGIKVAQAITVKGEGGGLIHIGQSGGSIEITTGGDLVIKGGTVDITGSSINIKGQEISNN